jgi:hypothetical protein
MRTVLIAATAGALTLTGVGAAQASDDVTVMTRSVFLGADLGPALRATGGREFVTAVGEIVRQVEATNFTKRAKGLAEEVQQRKPDLIGLQEVALWRKGKVNLNAVYNQQPSATKVHQDFLKILLKEINKGKATYEVVKVQDELDFEAPADVDNKTKDLRGAQYSKKNSFSVKVANFVTVTSLRGWLSARVQK